MNKKKKFFIIKLIILFIILLSFFGYHYFYNKVCFEVRYAFDFGSGAIKSKAVLFDVCANKVNKVFGSFNKHTKFINCFPDKDQGLVDMDQKCITLGIIEFGNFEKEYNISCLDVKCIGVATAWARKANNIDRLINALAATGLKLKILSQHEEGVYGFNAVLHNPSLGEIEENDIIVWDIGGGSFQLATLDDKRQVHVYNGPHGIESFEKEIRQVLNYPANLEKPFFDHNLTKQAIRYAAEKYGKTILADKVLANKLKKNTVKIYGIGAPIVRGMKDQMNLPSILTLDDLKHNIKIFEGRTSEDVYWNTFPKLPQHYVKSAQISLILIQSIMEGAGIDKLHIIDASLSDALLYEKKLWLSSNK